MQTRVFDPLGMRPLAVVNKVVNTNVLEDRAYGFRKRFVYFGPNITHGLNCMDGVLLPTEFHKQAYEPIRLNTDEVVQESVLGKHIQPGLGWNIQDFPVVTACVSLQSFSNFYWRDLQKKNVIAVLSKSGFFLRTALIGEKLATVAKTL